MRKRKNLVVQQMLKAERRWHAQGWVSEADMQRLEWTGMSPPEPLTPAQVRSIRESVDLDVYAFANMLNTTARLLRRWEQGLNRPRGPALRFLQTIRARGVATVFPGLS